MKNKRIVYLVLIVAFLLLIPLIAMQFTSEVNWGVADFVLAGVLLFGAGLVADRVLVKVKSKKYRIAILVALFILLLLVWAELGVGIFNSPFAGS